MSKQKKKSDITDLVINAMTDLIIGIILLILDKLLS